MWSGLTRDYVQGYTKRLKDVQREFQMVNNELKNRKLKMNYSYAEQICKLMIENRRQFRDDLTDGNAIFIRTTVSDNGKRDKLEVYINENY